MKIILLFIVLLISSISFAQKSTEHRDCIREAYELKRGKNYKRAAEKFQQAFELVEGRATLNDRLNAAGTYALSGDKDNAFFHLFRFADNVERYGRSEIPLNSDFDSLRSDERWEIFLELIKSNMVEYEKDLDKELMSLLDTVNHLDLFEIIKIQEIEEEYGPKSKELESHLKFCQKIDSIDLVKVTKVLDERGWLGSNIIGHRASRAMYMVILRADTETQVKYLPMLEEAVKLGNADSRSFVTLKEKIANSQSNK